MAQIGCFLWAIFFIILGFSMMPGYMTFVVAVSFMGGLLDGYLKIKKKKEKEERERQKRLNQDPRLKDDFDPTI